MAGIILPLYSQTLSAFTDYRGYFYVFDDGHSQMLEYFPPQSYKVGGACLAYLDNRGVFKIFFKNNKITLEKYRVTNYFSTNNLLVYTLESQLVVFDKGKRLTLVYHPDFYMFGDSIVAFYDEASSYLKAYYDGEVVEIEAGLSGRPMKSMVVGDNLFAYVDQADYFKIFYRGNLIEESYRPNNYKVGGNIVAYVTEAELEFKVFYKGATFYVENFEPQSYWAGEDMVAYVDETGSFKVYYKGEVLEISSFEPEFYYIKTNMLVYSEGDFLKVFTDGQSHTLANYIPEKYYVHRNVVAFVDEQDQLQGFYKGQLETISYEKLNNIEIFGNAVSFEIGIHANKTYYKGTVY